MEPRICDGHGDCLCQCDDGNYRADHKHPMDTCTHNCQPKKCPNFLVCGSIVPEWLLLCKRGRCVHCDMMFGKIMEFSEVPEECPVCLETATCVNLINCDHKMCVSCFKRCCDGPPKSPEPPFPYPELEDEYFDGIGNTPANPMFYDPLVVKYNRDWNAWDDAWNTSYSREKSLRKCPLCRKSMVVWRE